jgi:hypothetical protein
VDSLTFGHFGDEKHNRYTDTNLKTTMHDTEEFEGYSAGYRGI